MGGIGKTQIALEYVYIYREYYDRIFWISAIDQGSLLSGFQKVAAALAIPSRAGSRLQELADDVLKRLQGAQKWLIVFDNVDNAELVKGLLPENGPQKHTLITTKNLHTHGIPADPLEVPLLDCQDCVKLISTISNIHIAPDSPEHKEAERIALELGYLPLAIEQAGSYIREILHDIFSFLPKYHRSPKRIHERVPHGNRDYEFGVWTTCQLSFEGIDLKSRDATKLLSFFSFLHPVPILFSFVHAGSEGLDEELQQIIQDEDRFEEAVFVMEQFSVVQPRQTEGVEMHRLVRAVIQDSLSEASRQRIIGQLVQLGISAFPSLDTGLQYEKCRQFLQQVMACLGPVYAHQDDRSWLIDPYWQVLVDRVEDFLLTDGDYFNSLGLTARIITRLESLYGKYQPVVLAATNSLALAHDKLGNWEKARDILQQLITTSTRILGEGDEVTVTAKYILASALGNLGHWKEAADFYAEVVKIRSRLLGREHPDTLLGYDSLAAAYGKLKKPKKALKIFQWVFDVCDPEDPTYLYKMYNMGSGNADLGNWKTAVVWYETTLNLAKKNLGPEQELTVWTMNGLALAYIELERPGEAVTLLETTLRIRTEKLGPEAPRTLWIMHYLARAYRELGRWEESSNLFRKTLNLREKVLGPNHPDTMSTRNEMESLEKCRAGSPSK